MLEVELLFRCRRGHSVFFPSILVALFSEAMGVFLTSQTIAANAIALKAQLLLSQVVFKKQ